MNTKKIEMYLCGSCLINTFPDEEKAERCCRCEKCGKPIPDEDKGRYYTHECSACKLKDIRGAKAEICRHEEAIALIRKLFPKLSGAPAKRASK